MASNPQPTTPPEWVAKEQTDRRLESVSEDECDENRVNAAEVSTQEINQDPEPQPTTDDELPQVLSDHAIHQLIVEGRLQLEIRRRQFRANNILQAMQSELKRKDLQESEP
jgi:hypothetical protein